MIRVFAVGSPRSGTTLLQRLLAERVGLATLRESFLVSRVQSPSRPLRRLGLARRGAVAAAAEAVGRTVGPVPLLDRRRTVGVVRAAAVALDEMAKDIGAPGWVEKTPRHLRHVPLLTTACHPRFVHILRDGADVVVSVVAITERQPERWRGSRSALDAARRWAADVEIHRRWADHPDHAFVRFEDLVADVDRWAVGAAAWLGTDGPVHRTVAPGEIAFASEPWKLAALHEVSADTTSVTTDRDAGAQALRDDPEVGPILQAAAEVAATLPYDRLLWAPRPA
ncbi:MAG TPA: sulfotransferase [Iamia sp.]|nr:sulfotransferase [Iamia sp.]